MNIELLPDRYPYKRYIAATTAASIIGAAGALGAAGMNAWASGKMNKRAYKFNTEEAEKQREYSTQMWNESNAWNLEQWNRENAYNEAYNSPAAQVQRLRDAGLNPMYYGLDGNSNSAGAFDAAQPLGYDRANAPSVENPVTAGLEAFNSVRSIQKDIELKNAQIDKLKEDTTGVKLDNEWKDKTLEARQKSIELSNNMTEEDIKSVQQNIKESQARVNKLIEEAKTEQQKQAYTMAQTILSNAQANEIVSLLPFKQLLMEAQTDAQKASAASAYAQASINNGLIKAGYVDKTIDNLVAQARQHNANADSAEAQKAINEWKMSVRNGTVFDPASYSTEVQSVLADVMNGFFGIISTASEAVGGGLSGFFK